MCGVVSMGVGKGWIRLLVRFGWGNTQAASNLSSRGQRELSLVQFRSLLEAAYSQLWHDDDGVNVLVRTNGFPILVKHLSPRRAHVVQNTV